MRPIMFFTEDPELRRGLARDTRNGGLARRASVKNIIGLAHSIHSTKNIIAKTTKLP